MSPLSLLWLLAALLTCGSASREADGLCGAPCAATSDPRYPRGTRYTYRYSAVSAGSPPNAPSESTGLALDCLLDVDVLPGCRLLMKLRNSQIKRVSPQKEGSVQRVKNLREALERNPLMFSLRDGKVARVCPWEGDPVWALNIKRAIVSMLQTSHAGEPRETVKETDVYGTCVSRYERRGSVLVKTRDLRGCLRNRLAGFWLHSVPLSQDNVVESSVQCVQRHGDSATEEVNCTETVRLAPLAGRPVGARVHSVSTLTLLRMQDGAPASQDLQVYSGDLRFEDETGGPARARQPDTPESADTVRRLCAVKSDQQQEQADLFLHLVFQLRVLSHRQLQQLWQEASFKCRDDWQPLLDALPACGSEACVSLMAELLRGGDLEPERASSFLAAFAFVARPSASTVGSVAALLQSPETRTGALLAVSSMVHTLCLRTTSPCSLLPQVQQLLKVLKEMLEELCGEGDESQLTEKLHILKAVGNAGLAAAALVPELEACAQSQTTLLELRLAAIQAFRRIPCTADRRALVQLYCSPREDVEIRIAAYQQIMRCPDRDVLRRVSATLKNETSSQVGSYVWSHLTQIQKTDDPLKQTLMEMLSDDIISKDFEGETWKYSSYMDTTVDTGFGSANVEGALVFSPSSFVPRSAMVNLTAHILGRAFNLLEIDLRVENADPLLRKLFGHHEAAPSHDDSGPQAPVDPIMREKRSSEGTVKFSDDGPPGQGEKGGCWARSSHLRQAGAMFTGHRPVDHGLRCGIGVKVFGNELAFVTCDDVAAQGRRLSLSLAGMAVQLLKGQEVQFHRRAVLATEELLLPSLSGWPIKVAVNMSASLSIRIKGSAILKSWSHFSVSGYVKPSAYVGVSARMGLEGPCGRGGVEWLMGLRSSASLDGGVQLQRGQDLKVSLNTPEDTLDVVHFSSRMYSVSGDNREELTVSRDHTDRTTCSPQDWSRVLGWQLCSQVSYPSSPGAASLPPSGAVLLSLRLQKLDRGLRQYLLEAAYSLTPQKGSWLPTEASLHLFLGTPQSSIPRDLSLDFTFSSPKQRLLLKMRHPLKSIQVQGQIDQARSTHNAKLELWVDGVHHYYVKGLTDVQTLPTEQKLLTHLEAKLTAGGRPVVLAANLTRGLGRKISLSAMMRNVFKETASLSVLLERRLELAHRQYSVDIDLLLPGLLGTRVFGLMQNRASQWSSALRVKYGLRGDARNLRHECHTAQTARNEMQPNATHHLRAEHELHCSHATSVNHKLLLRHEEGPGHVRSVLDLSYGKHWDEINNKRRVLLSQSFKNQSRHALTSYLLEFSLQVLEKHLSYRTQLLHSHLRQKGAESSTHLKVNYNDQLPLVAGLHWRDLSKAHLRRWEGAFNMDTPWLYVYTAHKLSQPQRRAIQFSTELTTRKWVTLRSLVLEGFYQEKNREREGRLHLYTPTDTYFKVSGWGATGKQSLKASGALSSAWTPTLRGDISLEGKKDKKALQLVSSYGRQNISISASVITVDKRLRKRLVAMKVVLMEPKGLPVELELEGAVEELKRDRELYQKQGTLRLRQPFLHFPQKLLLHEVFTVDLRRSRYILESRAVLSGNKECLHRLTLSYHPGKPSVCSALTHPFRSETVPQDSELCITLHTNQSQQEVQGTVRVNKKDRLIVLGQVHNISDPSRQGWVFQVNLTHLLQIQMPQSVSLQGALYWKPSNDSTFGYVATGKAIVDHQRESQFAVQLNGSSGEVGLYSSFSQHHSSTVPETCQAHARAEREGGRVGTSVRVKTDGEERADLEAELTDVAEEDARLLGARVVLRQRLVPILQDLDVQLWTNVSADRMSAECSMKQAGGSLQAQLSGALEPRPGLRASIRGGLQHSLASLSALPPTLGLEGALRQSPQLTEGHMTVVVEEAAYGLELHHQGAEGPWDQGALGVEPGRARAWLHMHGPGQNLHVNVSSNLGGSHSGGLHATLSHSSAQLLAAGLPPNSSMRASWTNGERGISMVTELRVGSQSLRAEMEAGQRGQGPPRWELSSSLQHHCTALLESGVPRAADISGHYQAEPNAASARLAVQVDRRRKAEVLVEGRQTNGSVRVAASMEHDVKGLLGVLPTRLQMDCSGDAGADRLSGRCSGAVADQAVEMPSPRQLSANGTVATAACGLRLDARMESGDGEGAGLSLAFDCAPKLRLQADVQHTLPPLQRLGIPARNALTVSAQKEPGPAAVRLDLTLGRCKLRVQGHADRALGPEGTGSGWAANLSNGCLVLKEAGVPESLELSGLLSLSPCRFALSCSLTADGEALALQLSHSCSPTHSLTGAVTHSFSRLGSWGLPPESRLVLTASGGPGRDGTLLLNAGSCRVRASGDMKPGGRSQWVWTTETECPLLEGFSLPAQSRFNGSLLLEDCALEVRADAQVDGERASVRLTAGCRQGLRLEGLPEHGSLMPGSRRAPPLRYGAELELRVRRCALGVSGGLRTAGRLEGSLLLHNNCTALQDLGAPSRVEGHGSLLVNPEFMDSRVSLVSGDTHLQALLNTKAAKNRQEVLAKLTHSATLLREVGLPTSTTLSFSSERGRDSYRRALSCSLDSQQISEDFSVERTGTEVRVEYHLDHSVAFLRGWGMPENNSVEAKLDFGQAKRLSVRSQLGDRFVSLGVHLKDAPICTEVTGTLEHSWAWLQEQGLPSTVEVLCSIQGSFPQLQARAHLSTDGEKLLASALNVSVAGGRLALLLSLVAPPHLVPGPLRSLDVAVAAHCRGSQKHVSMDLYCNGTRVRLAGEVTVWGASGREARVALQHNTEREDMPAIQVEAWGRLTETQLRGSLAWNPKTNSSLAITVQGLNLPARKELNCKVHQSIPALQLYLPPQLDAKTQVNHTSSTLHGLAEVKLGGNELWALGELSIAESGYKQAVEVKHSFPQLKSLPRSIVLNAIYEGGNRTCGLQQRIVWGGQELNVSGLYLSPKEERGARRLQVQMTGTFATLPSACGLDVQLERSAHRLLDSIVLDWKGQGTTEKVTALCSRTSDDELWEGRVELRQPFTPPLSHLHLRALSHAHAGGQRSGHQAWLSWNDGKPVNVTLMLNRQWQGSSTRGQACLFVSPGQVRAVLPLAEMEGCGAVAREGNSYSQTAELKWGGKRITQAMKYQRGAGGGHTLQLEGGADNVSPQPCPSHTLLAQVHTNGRDQLEHHLLLGLCPPHPSWAVSGYHRVGVGQELFYSQTRLSVSGQSQYSGLTVVLTNTSTPPRTNFSLHTELKVGDGALELGGSVFSSRRGGGLQVRAALDRSECLWLQGALEGRCMQAAAGYNDGGLSDDNLTVALCLEGRRRITLEAQKTEGGVKPESLASISLRAAGQRLTFTAQGCMENLEAAEARVRVLGSRVRNKLLEKIRVLQHLLLEIRRQSQDSALLREMSEGPLRWAQKAEALLVQRAAGAWDGWRKGVLRHSLTDRVPRCLESLRRLSLQLQQELKRPLATLAGAYQDATGRRLDTAWKRTVALWSRKLSELLPAVLEEHQLGAPLKTTLGTLSAALDLASQQMAQWAESRLAAALAGIRRRLASLYKLSHGRCEVSVQLPLPRGAWSDVGGAGAVEFLLEEWLLRPVVTAASLRPTAELYRLKRRMMESPFNHQALLVSDQFALSFDGRLHELPGRCPLLLARDLTGGSFTVVLSPGAASDRALLVEMGNATVSISHRSQAEMNCRETEESFGHGGVSVRRDGVLVQVSNRNGALLSCDLSQELCSLTLDGWRHGASLGLLGTNDNEAGNELTLPNGSRADGEDHFLQSWQLKPRCRRGPCSNTSKAEATSDLPSCASLFSDLDSPLGSCFRVVDPGQFLAVCERSRCHRASAPCRLAAAFVHVCRRNYVPLELPELCVSV